MWYALIRILLRPVARWVYRPTVEGLHHVPRTGPVILASNHLSFVDSFVLPLIVPRRVTFIAKTEYFDGTGVRGAFKRGFFTAIGAVPVPRDEGRAAMASLGTALEILEAGGAFGIYPEGTRSPDGRLYRGRTGIGWLALASKAPIVPVALVGTDRIQPIGARLPRVRPVTVRFGAPLHVDDVLRPDGPGGPGSTGSPRSSDARARRAVTDAVMEAIRAMSGQEYAGTYSSRRSTE